jgi:hypothetical protein
VVHRLRPFTIRLKDRLLEDSVVQPIGLKIDPGSKTTGMAIVREEETPEGKVHHVLHLAEVQHKLLVAERMRKRAQYQRRRRSAHLRYRPPRFDNRRRPRGWLTPIAELQIADCGLRIARTPDSDPFAFRISHFAIHSADGYE